MHESTIDVTCVRIKLPEPWEPRRILAYVRVEINGCIAVGDIKLVQRADGRAVIDWPKATDRTGRTRCVAHATNRAAHATIEMAVLLAYREALDAGERLCWITPRVESGVRHAV